MLDYLSFLTMGVFFLIFLNVFKGRHTMQFFILAAFIFFYIYWGAYHHIRDKTLHLKVMLEYILIGIIVLLLLQTLLL